MRSTLHQVSSALLTLAALACGDSPSGPDRTPASFTAISGNAQSGMVGVTLGSPITVRVANAAGEGISGVEVTWRVTGGGGSLASVSTETDDDGHASASWRVGTVAGIENNTVTVTIEELPSVVVLLTATANPGPASRLRLVSGASQSAPVAGMLAQPLVVQTRDLFDNVVSGGTVEWGLTAGQGQLSATSTLSDVNGNASVTWTVGTAAGTNNNRATATVRGVPTSLVEFLASAASGPAVQLAIVSGDNQSAEVGFSLDQPLVVVARDQYNNVVAGARVDWAVTAGEGTLSVPSNVTGANGRASVTWKIGRSRGTDNNTATAMLNGIPTSLVAFTASGITYPATITIVAGQGQTGEAGTALPIPLKVLVRDRAGNPVPDAVVEWREYTGFGGSLTPSSSTTDADGHASAIWTLGTVAAAHGVHARVGVTYFVEFGARAIPGPPRRIAITGGAGQQAPAGVPLPAPLRVRVTDTLGNFVNGVSVQWTVATGGGSLTNPTSLTSSDGTATNEWTLGPANGPQRVSAQIPEIAGAIVEFNAIASPGGRIRGVVSVSAGLFAAGGTLSTSRATRTVSLSTMVRRSTMPRPSKLQNSIAAAGVLQPISRPQRSGAIDRVADELIVTYQTDAIAGLQPAVLARSGRGTVNAVALEMRSRMAAHQREGRLRVLGTSPLVRATRIRVANPASIDSVAAALRREPGVARVERNRILRSFERPVRAPTQIAAVDPIYIFQAWAFAMIDVPEAWMITKGSSAVLVAVIDDGIRFDHPDLAPHLTTDGYDFVSGSDVPSCSGGTVNTAGDGDGYDANPTIPVVHSIDPEQECVTGTATSGGHGLHVAGTIGARSDAQGVTGVSQVVRIRPVRVLNTIGGGTTYDIAQGILYAAGLPADNGAGGTVQAASRAPIINMSLGGADADVMRSAVAQATAAGSLIIAAAGNSAESTPAFPAAYDDVISVSAVGPDGLLASYSNFGSTVDIAAPGGDFNDGDCTYGVISAWWDFAAGLPAVTCTHGTSMAAPHVSGVAALLLARTPGLSNVELRSRLLAFAVDRGAPGLDEQYGAGIVNARNSLTQSLAPPRQLYAQIYSATTGATIGRVLTGPGGTFEFDALVGDAYHVYAGEDANGDARTGVPGRRWGAFGSSAVPTPITVQGVSEHEATFTVGMPTELEPNDVRADANSLPLEGYITGSLSSPTDVDFVRVVLPKAGRYLFETSPVAGACGFALEEDTILTIFDANGTQLFENDDIDNEFTNNFCSRISPILNAGTYLVRISGYYGGRYRVTIVPFT